MRSRMKGDSLSIRQHCRLRDASSSFANLSAKATPMYWAYPRARRGFLCPVQSDGGSPQCGQARLFYQIMTMLPVAQHDSHMEMSPAPSEALGGYKRLGGRAVSKPDRAWCCRLSTIATRDLHLGTVAFTYTKIARSSICFAACAC